MTKAIIAANVCLVALLFLSAPRSALATEAEKTAAEIDWVPAASLPAARRDALPWFCTGEYTEPPPVTDLAPGFVRATADSGSYEMGKDTDLAGHVHIEQGYHQIEAPHVHLDATKNFATIEGPLVIRDKGLTLTGSHGTSDLNTGAGEVDQATFLLHVPKLRGHAKRIERAANTDMYITRGKFTRCEPGSNAWAIDGKAIHLEPRTGYGTARDVKVELRGVTVAYLPYFRFPIDDKRHSGFLFPSIGYDHSGGTDLILPIYFNLAPSYDFTYQPHSLWKRGLVHEVQFRFLAGQSSNEINAGYIARDQVYDDRNLLDQTTANINTSAADVTPFQARDRWLLNLRHTGNWTNRWSSSVNYSAVSDIDYLHDIGGDVGSTSVDTFVNSVDQNLSSQRSAALDRVGKINYRGDNWTSGVTVRGYQNLATTMPEQYRLLPQLNADYSNQFGPVETDLQFQYTNFGKYNDGLSGPLAIVGQRGVIDAAFSVRKATSWAYIQPRFDLLQRSYEVRDTPTGYPTHPTVTTPRASIDAGLYFDRFFHLGQLALRQTLEPRVFYLYTQNEDQDLLPQFDSTPLTPSFSQLFRDNRFNGLDRIGDAKQVSAGLTTRFLNEDTGAQYFVADLGQIYYLRDRTVIFRPTPVEDPTAPRSPLFLDARFSLSNGLGISGAMEWEPSAGRTNRSNFSLRYVAGDRKIFNLSYVYTNPKVQPVGQFKTTAQSDLSFVWPIHGRWSAIGRWNFGWDLDQTIESIVGIEYNDCCWKSRLVFRHFLKEPRTITVLQDDPTSSTGYTAVTQTIVPSDTG
ncbi:MAG TPA: LPS assembly protein LptD, partial [Pseudomonadales bacterium]|nr:LPS assembly protein LptD [Pseudomonadales bacterium]